MTIIHIIAGRTRDLGGFSVSRVLPSPELRIVGPFVFFDHLGPATFDPGHGMDVRPHPHIGLATVTYLFEGAIGHRDSLGTVVDVEPGAVNWMTTGRGITHSERTPAARRASGQRMHGIQSWVALPQAHAEDAPTFVHHPAASLPSLVFGGARRTLIAGSAFDATSPVAVLSPMFYVDVEADTGAEIVMPDYAERAVYIVSGAIEVDGERHDAGRMLVFAPGGEITWRALEPTRAMLLGGASMDGPRHIEWNFVSASRERIAQAKDDWRAGRFPIVPGESEFIPLPDEPLKVAEGSPTS